MDQNYSQAEFEAVLETLVDGVIIIDQAGIMTLFNRACQSMFGYLPSEVLGKNVKMLMPNPYKNEHDGYLKRYINTGERRIIGIGREVVGLRKNGSTFPMDLSVGESEHPGQPVFVGIIRDLTDRHKRQAKFEQIQEEFFHLSRIVSINEMGTAIAHEVNQPIGASINYIETARMVLRNETSIDKEHLESILEAAKEQSLRASNIILRLRAFLEKGHIEPKLVNVATLIDTSLQLTKVYVKEKNVDIQIDVDDNLPCVRIDITQIQQVMVNLIRNAFEAMSESRDKLLKISARLGSCGERVEIRVADTGHGLTPSDTETLFVPFSSNKKDGLGMGLSISQSIISRHDGQIWAHPNSPKGTIFHFTLPSDADDS